MRGTVTTCLTCGKKYKVCPHCGDASWRQTACSPVCWQISTIINRHFYHLIDSETAKTELENVHYTDVELTAETQSQIDAILGDVKPRRRKRKPQEQAASDTNNA